MLLLAGVLLLLLLLTYQLVAQPASDSPPSYGVNCLSQRTLFNIVWGCITTTITCAWTTLHPNIPPRESPFKATLRKLELMFWTIVAPEILPCWALNQLLAAMTVRDMYNEGKGYKEEKGGIWKTLKGWFSLYEIKEAASQVWTLKHGHFLIMGGFHVVEPPEDGSTRSTEANLNTGKQRVAPDAVDDPPTSAPLAEATNTDTEKERGPSENEPEAESVEGRVTILTLEMLRELVKDPGFKIQTTEEDIGHMSKGEGLSKIIFTLQSTWFIMQCIGRWAQGLNLTQLELTTLALASLNGVIFALWWDKPLGAQAVIRVHLKRKLTDAEREAGHQVGQSYRSGFISGWRKIYQKLFGCFGSLVTLPFAIPVILLFTVFAFAVAFLATISDLLGIISSFPADATHVPTFYVPKHRYSESLFHALLLIALGAIFGAIHCIGWNLPFPTHTEQILWRIASLAVTVIPITALLFTLILAFIVKLTSNYDIFRKSFSNYGGALGAFIFIMVLLAYVAARLVLLGQALVLLRHLPPSAFIAVDWTKFYPHLFS